MALIQFPKNFARIAASDNNHNWSDEQEEIFGWFAEGEGNLVVRARAGTAKTTSIIEGINRAPERRILLAAFNKAIAEELQARIKNPSARAQTLHALGMSFCRRHINDLDVDTHGERARALAKAACIEIAKKAGENASDVAQNVVAEVAALHTKIREILVDPAADFAAQQAALVKEEEIADHFNRFWSNLEAFAIGFGCNGFSPNFWSLEKVVEAALMAIEFAKAPTNIIDFADMIFLPLVHGWTAPVCDLLVVDECQDMTLAQLRLALGATKKVENGGRVCVVGDDLQAIYAFRGADSDSLDRLKGELDAIELGLKTTYRCPRRVVELAQSFAPDFQAAPDCPEGDVVKLDSSQAIVKYAEPRDFVLSRTNAPLVRACLDLIRSGIAAYVKGSEIGKAALHLLDKLLDQVVMSPVYGGDVLTGLEVELESWLEREVKKAELLSQKARTAKIAQVQDQHDLLGVFIEGSKVLKGETDPTILDHLRSQIETTFADTPKVDAVMCSTVHKAKGLEATRVFLLGRTFSPMGSEERNICYVAATRAKDTLYLVGVDAAQFAGAPNCLTCGGRIDSEDWARGYRYCQFECYEKGKNAF